MKVIITIGLLLVPLAFTQNAAKDPDVERREAVAHEVNVILNQRDWTTMTVKCLGENETELAFVLTPPQTRSGFERWGGNRSPSCLASLVPLLAHLSSDAALPKTFHVIPFVVSPATDWEVSIVTMRTNHGIDASNLSESNEP